LKKKIFLNFFIQQYISTAIFFKFFKFLLANLRLFFPNLIIYSKVILHISNIADSNSLCVSAYMQCVYVCVCVCVRKERVHHSAESEGRRSASKIGICVVEREKRFCSFSLSFLLVVLYFPLIVGCSSLCPYFDLILLILFALSNFSHDSHVLFPSYS